MAPKNRVILAPKAKKVFTIKEMLEAVQRMGGPKGANRGIPSHRYSQPAPDLRIFSAQKTTRQGSNGVKKEREITR